MNAVEIEAAVSDLACQPFDPKEFPFAFLQAFGNKETTIKRLRAGASNKSDIGGVLQRGYIHIAVAQAGDVSKTLRALRTSPATTKAKALFILTTDGEELQAEDLKSGETIACAYRDFPDHFGFFLQLADITTVKEIRESSFDIRATSRLNRLYIELLKDNPEWETAGRRHDMNHFLARLIFCFFAEDTDIFADHGLFTKTVSTMGERDSSNTHEVISEIFRSMNTRLEERETVNLPRWANAFPYVNGGLFSGSPQVPRFSRIARAYLLDIGGLDWTRINPDIFGSMIQAVAEDEERDVLGMHYTSVPNILKVLNPLFLDELRAQLREVGSNPRILFNLRKRISRIRIFDPACGSGNFLVIAYKQMREIESVINERRGERGRKSDIPLTNFRGIELRDFAAEVARLALIIAEFQCDVLYRGQKEALAEFLPLNSQNWIASGNALQLDWVSICPPAGTGVRLHAADLFATPLEQAEIDFENEGGETYVCGNPPYAGSKRQTATQKSDLSRLFAARCSNYKILDYVSGWFLKAADYVFAQSARAAFVATNSICQGEQVPILWPLLFSVGVKIAFAHRSFKWHNLASNNAGVTVVVVGLTRRSDSGSCSLFDRDEVRKVASIGPYLIPGSEIVVSKRATPLGCVPTMQFGNHPYYGGALILSPEETRTFEASHPELKRFLRPFFGTDEFIEGRPRSCLWLTEEDAMALSGVVEVQDRINAVRARRLSAANDSAAQKLAAHSYRFRDQRMAKSHVVIVARHSSENRVVLPVDLLGKDAVVSDAAFAIYDAPLWSLAIIASTLHIAWVEAVCGKLETRFRYSNTLGWNSFPVPSFTQKNKNDLARCAEDILLMREQYYPATIAQLYDADGMPADLREAHEHNDEVLERIYIGRRFRNDTERLEKLFELYTRANAANAMATKSRAGERT